MKSKITNQLLSSLESKLSGEKNELKNIRLLDDVDFSEDEMFGEADAFIEDVETLKGYAVERTDCELFYNNKKKFILLSAPKGMGKTTICKLWQDELAQSDDVLTIMPNYTNLSIFKGTSDFAELSSIWKRRILTQVLISFCGNKIKSPKKIFDEYGFDNNQMRKIKIKDFLISSVNYHDFENTDTRDSAVELIKSSDKEIVWFFLDEFDADFTKEVFSITKLAALINAVRDITNEFSNIIFRMTIRPNVWAILRSNFSLMSNFKDIILELDWSPLEIRAMIAKRVERYLKSYTNIDHAILDNLNLSKEEREKWLVSQIFDTSDFDLGKGNRPPEVVLSKLCTDRPRWVIELCKSSIRAKHNRLGIIFIRDVINSFKEVGASRYLDLISEYQNYCPNISDVLNAFHNSKSSYSLLDLLAYVDRVITSKIPIEIAGVSTACSPKQVINFLYELTFVEPKKKTGKREYIFLHFKDFPNLIETNLTNEKVEEDLYWVIHPAFRNYFNIGIPENRYYDN